MKKLNVHDGCVNTICWNRTGEYILSGSDDCNLVLTKPTNMFDTSKEYTVLHKIPTRHLGNIFSADFIVNSGDQQLVSCSSEGPVIVHDINATNPSDGFLSFSCHTSTIYDVVTVLDHDKIFLSCGEDKTVRLFDMRVHNSCRRNDTCPHPALIKNSHAMTTLRLHPLNSNLMLVGRADGLGLVYDRRKLPDVTKYTREQAHADRLSGLPSRTGEYRFKHPLDGVVTQFTVPDMEEKCRFTSLCYNRDGTEVLASFSGDYIYLFDHDRSSNMELIQTLPKTVQAKNDPTRSENHDNNGNQDSTNGNNDNNNDNNMDCNVRSPHQRRARQISRIRVRGDWSDTGVASVPLSRRSNADASSEATRQNAEQRPREPVIVANEQPQGNDRSLAIGVRLLDHPSRLTQHSGPNLEIFDRSINFDPTSRGVYLTSPASTNQNDTRASRQPERTIEEEDESDDGNQMRSDPEEEPELNSDDYTEMTESDDDDTSEIDDPTGQVHIDSVSDFIGLARHTVRSVMSEAHAEYRCRSKKSRLRRATRQGDSDDGEAISSSSNDNGGAKISGASQEKRSDMLKQSARAKFRKTLDELKNKYDHIQGRAPQVKYQGHRNSRTSIQQAIFWGDDYVMSGSDCGRIMVWEKDTARLMMGFPADERVVNCLAPNPRNYVLASSGIDYDIKLWSTQALREGPLQVSDEEMKRIIENNELMLEESKHTISVPPHLFFRVLASLVRSSR